MTPGDAGGESESGSWDGEDGGDESHGPSDGDDDDENVGDGGGERCERCINSPVSQHSL